MVQLRVIVLGLLAAVCCFTGAAEGKVVKACRGDVVRMPCDGAKKIKVKHVSFKVGENSCLKGKPYVNPRNTHCYNPFAVPEVRSKCDGKYYCAFAVNEKMFGKWSCGKRTNWTLEITYTCV